MVRVIEQLADDWRRLDERIDGLSGEIEAIARRDAGCERLMSVPGIGPIISSAIVAAIGRGDAFGKGRDFAAWISAANCTSRRTSLKTGIIVRSRPLASVALPHRNEIAIMRSAHFLWRSCHVQCDSTS
jgi:transposase